MIRYLISLSILMLALPLYADELPEGLVLTQAPIDQSDMASIKRGGQFFAANCMSCHTMVYLRYSDVAKEVGVTYDKMPIHVTNWPYGVTPPDLSLETQVRGVDWVYTYLHSFYQDSARPTGVNNLLLPGTAMPDIVAPFQGQQVLITHPMRDYLGQAHYYDLLKLVKSGSVSPEQFDQTIADVVNFLAYGAEPYRIEQHRIGWWVLGFLCVLFVFMYMLKREYWRDVKKQPKE